MPGKNTVKLYGANQYYHIYSRGVNKQSVFLDADDFVVFLGILKRYLSPEPYRRQNRTLVPTYFGRIDLLTYCLMKNHIHLLVYAKDDTVMIALMRSIMTSYGMYFNKKYKRVGPVFQSRYKASLIDNQSYLEHISRYIHLNPKNWLDYDFSSLKYFLYIPPPAWLITSPVLELFENSSVKYLAFLKDYKQHQQMLEEIKWELANDIDEED